MEPVPLAAAQRELPAGGHVSVAVLRFAGMVSVTVTPATSLGPLLVTTMVYVVEVPATMVVFPSSFVTVRSAMSVPSVADAEPLLLAGSGSGVGLETIAVLRMTSGPAYPLGTRKVTVMVRVAPGDRVPRLHGNPVGHSGLDWNVKPGGGGSATLTLVAVDGPRLTMLSVNVTGWPRTAVGLWAVFVSARSA